MKKIITTALCTAMILSSVTAFADKKVELSEKPEIKFLQENGYLKGRENGLELESHVTRAEALTMLLRVCDEENAAATNEDVMIMDYELITGEFVKLEDEGIVINTENGPVLINTEFAALRGSSLDEAKEGNLVSAVVSTQMTRSIPAKVNGYAVMISETTALKLVEVMDVEKEDGVYNIISADGEYIVVADENTPVTPFKSRNIMKIDDIDDGDKLIVLSDVMTMSIPARLMPNEIIVMENSFDDKDFVDTKGHWAEKIIKYSYKNGYVDGESDTHFNPEGKVKGREMVKMMLSKLGKEDITIENAYKTAIDCGLIEEDFLEDAIENNAELTREEISKLCYKYIKLTKPETVVRKRYRRWKAP